MKHLALWISVALAVALGATGPARTDNASRFFSVIEDLPLMPGLREDEDQGLAFDSPQGRIVEAYAVGDLGQKDVLGFYQAALPQLGWRETEQGTFVREREVLKVQFTADLQKGTQITVHFSLAPAAD
jgi:hypothetical protein